MISRPILFEAPKFLKCHQAFAYYTTRSCNFAFAFASSAGNEVIYVFAFRYIFKGDNFAAECRTNFALGKGEEFIDHYGSFCRLLLQHLLQLFRILQIANSMSNIEMITYVHGTSAILFGFVSTHLNFFYRHSLDLCRL